MLLGLVAAETIGEGEADDSVKVHVRPPVLFLTARSAVNDVVEGFELGGNDYLKKPFFLSFNKRIECFFEVFVEPLGWVSVVTILLLKEDIASIITFISILFPLIFGE